MGHSLYGLYAFEAAQQLTAAGEQVRFLALMDTFLPAPIRLRFPLRTRARIQAAAVWWLMSRGRFFDAGQFVFNAAKDVATRTTGRPSEQAAERSIEDVLRVPASRYQPRTYSGGMIYLQAEDQPIPLHLGSRIGWEGLATGGFELRVVPGTHNNLLERPQVAAIAAVLSEFLAAHGRAAAAAGA